VPSGEPQFSTWDDRFAADFARLNRAWLEGHDLLEEGDLKYLNDPRGSIVDHGGEVFIATVEDVLVGTCGIVPTDDGRAELVKLTTDARARGLGIGTTLTRMALDWAKARRLSLVYLVSSTKLTDAIRLYERLGFRHRPLPPDPGYVTADVYMEFDLSTTAEAE
jgi:ribosomal protein S18 acetylase RimI-like enzyme